MAAPSCSWCEQQQTTRDRLLRSAGELFLTEGFDTICLDRIATHAGYTRGAIVGIFTGKAEMGAAVLDELYRHVTERMRIVRITTADQLVTIVTTWGYRAVTRPGWIRLELSLAADAAPAGSIPLARLITALGGWLSCAAEDIGVQTAHGEEAAYVLMSLLAGLLTRHPDPAGITASLVRHRVELVLSTTLIRTSPSPIDSKKY
jgi:AcrR family transcriptional regulator